MKKFSHVLLAAILIVAANQASFGQKNYEKEWKELESFVGQGLPQSALAIADQIYLESKAERNMSQFLKALLYQVKLRADYQENHLETSIQKLEAELSGAQPPVVQVLNSVLAELYWRFYQENRFLFLDRTTTLEPDPGDLKTWDLAGLYSMISRKYSLSLENLGLLQSIPIGELDPILSGDKGTRQFRPTLYDFLAHRALDYFMNEEPEITRPAGKFELAALSEFDPSAVFSKGRTKTADTASLKRIALEIFRDLLAFHLNDSDPAALIDADLKRLKFVRNYSTLPAKDSLYLSALERSEKEFRGHPASADILYEIAMEHYRLGQQYSPYGAEQWRWNIKTAKEICDNVTLRFSETDAAKNCVVLFEDISRKGLSLNLHDASLPGVPSLALLSFRNIDKAWFRVLRIDGTEYRSIQQKFHHEELVKKLRAIPASKEWSLDLKNEGDHQQHSAQVMIPELPLGFYVILVSDNPSFQTEMQLTMVQSGGNIKDTTLTTTQVVAHSAFWVTSLSYISRREANGGYSFYVLDRSSGQPLAGVKAEGFTREYDYRTRGFSERKVHEKLSDSDGSFTIDSPQASAKSFYIVFNKGNDTYSTDNYFYPYTAPKEQKPLVKTYFFTDRAIYRPGQTIYFKGIVLEIKAKEKKIMTDHKTRVGLYDVNGQKIAELELETSEFGSFQGTFMAPAGVLLGQMSIRNESGSQGITVEEYKRPRFAVNIDPVTGNYRLEETVNVTGKAMAYSGAAIDHAMVSYRVVRNARFPFWRDWWGIYPGVPEQEITSGQTVTDKEGAFTLAFQAVPDRQTDRKFKPVFTFTIYVDVTDQNGEVHSTEETVSAGYESLIVDLEIPRETDIAGNNSFRLTAKNLNGQDVPASGEIVITPLQGSGRILKDRKWGRPDVFVISREEFIKSFPKDIYDDENNPETWAASGIAQKFHFDTGKDSALVIPGFTEWATGVYRLEIHTVDSFGQKVDVKEYFTAFDSRSKDMAVIMPAWFKVLKTKAEPGETVTILAGSAEKNARMLFEVIHQGKVISRSWKTLSREQLKLEVPVTEDYRGNFSIFLALVKDNRSYQAEQLVQVPYTNRELDIRFETFRDKLTPGQEEEWRIRISGKQGDKVAAEMIASLYDASLDAFLPHRWSFDIFEYYYSGAQWDVRSAFGNALSSFVTGSRKEYTTPVNRDYDRLNWFGYAGYGPRYLRTGKHMDAQRFAPGMEVLAMDVAGVAMEKGEADEATKSPASEQGIPDVSAEEKLKPEEPLAIRRNFEETAFFYPDLRTDENGDILIKFKVPESLTRWKMMGLAYTKDLKVGKVEKELVTSKDLMVVPNPPRFFREGDRMSFSAKVVSLAGETLKGTVSIAFYDARTMEPIDEKLGLKEREHPFTISKGASEVFYWEIMIPDGLEAIVYRVSAVSGSFSDGEEMTVPVLPNRMLVTESLPLPVSGKGSKNFMFSKLLSSGTTSSLKNYRLTLEMTSNPAWYAIQALPYLSEYPHENADALFNRLYANSVASYIANSSPRIRQVFDNWRNFSPDAFLSNLEKNQDLKAVVLEETPWVMQARNESERKKRVALLFDLNRMAREKRQVMEKLARMQTLNGGWPWFDGMEESRYITQLIIKGFGKLRQMGVIDLQKDEALMEMIRSGLYFMDDGIRKDYEKLKSRKDKGFKIDDNHLEPIQVDYLYARSFFQGMIDVLPNSREAFDYYKGQAAKYWLEQSRYLQGSIAVALKRMGDGDVPASIIRSLKEKALYSEEMGMYWRETSGYLWHEAPIERQAMMIEAFTAVTGDMASVEKMKIWLLKQKQTQDWKTGRATAEAVYVLLMNGMDLLASEELVEVKLGQVSVDPKNLEGSQPEAGTGYYLASWQGSDIKPGMGHVTVTKKDDGVAWGAVYWQYFEDMDKISPAQSPLEIGKKLYVERNSPSGLVLEALGPGIKLKTGDKVMVRITIRVDRDMEYVHMKDLRAAAFEPVSALSGYRYQGGLGYYESTKDASVNFYFDYLRKGTYIFEYAVMVTQRGEFSNGITSIQCLYAPEFGAHSEGQRISVF